MIDSFTQKFEENLLDLIKNEVLENLELDHYLACDLLKERSGNHGATVDLINFAKSILAEASDMGLVGLKLEFQADFDEENQPKSYPEYISNDTDGDEFIFHISINQKCNGIPWKANFIMMEKGNI